MNTAMRSRLGRNRFRKHSRKFLLNPFLRNPCFGSDPEPNAFKLSESLVSGTVRLIDRERIGAWPVRRLSPNFQPYATADEAEDDRGQDDGAEDAADGGFGVAYVRQAASA